MVTVFHSLATHFPGEFQQVLCSVCVCVCVRICVYVCVPVSARLFSFNLQLESLC